MDVRDLRKEYGGFVAVEGSTFRVDAGEVLGIVGLNGAGKTTRLKALTGLVPVRERAQSTYSFGALAVCLAAAFPRWLASVDVEALG